MSEIATDLETKDLHLATDAFLGKGSFGEVYKAKHNTDGQFYAIKVVYIPEFVKHYKSNPLHKTIFELKKEVCEFLAIFNSPYIVSYKDCWFGGPHAEYYKKAEKLSESDVSSTAYTPQAWLCIKMGYCQSNLRKWLSKNNSEELRKPSVFVICKQILKGLEYIHSQDVIHRDIKPSNILIKEEKPLLIQIGDFGLSTKVDKDQSLTSKCGPVGTRMYRSVEMWDAKSKSDYDCKTDIYSAGLVFLEVITPLFNNYEKREAAFNQVREGCYTFKTVCPLHELIKQMTTKDLSKRPGARMALGCLELGKETDCEFMQQNFPTSSKKASLLYKNFIKKPAATDSEAIETGPLGLRRNVESVERLAPAERSKDEPGKSTIGVCIMPSSSSSSNGNSATTQDNVSTLLNFKTRNFNPKLPISHGITLHVKNFTGRDQELKKLDSFSKNSRNPVLVCGFGGVGKTELSRKFLESKKTFFFGMFYSDISRVWLHGDTFESFKSSVFSFAFELGVENEKATPSQMFEYLTKTVLSQCQKVLVVIDNVDAKLNEVTEVIKMSRSYENIFIIVTSRDRTILGNAGETILLDVLSQTEAGNMLRNCINDISDSDADLLCKLVQNYPLALQQAVAYIKEQRENCLTTGYSVCDYVKEFEGKKLEMLDQRLNEIEHDYAMTTLVTWNVTFNKLSGDAIEVLKMLAFLEPDKIGFYFLREICAEFGFREEKFGNAINMLKRYSLVKVELVISIHRLVQDVMRQRVEDGFNKKMFKASGVVFSKSKALNLNLNEDNGWSHLKRICQLTHEIEIDYSNLIKLENPEEFLYSLKSQIAYKLILKNEYTESLELYEELLKIGSEYNEFNKIMFNDLIRLSQTNLSSLTQLVDKLIESKNSSLGNCEATTRIKVIKVVLAVILKSSEESERSQELFSQVKSYYDANPQLNPFYEELFLPIITAGKSFNYNELNLQDLERLLSVYKNVLGENCQLTLKVKNAMARKFYKNEEYEKCKELLEEVISSNIQFEVEDAYGMMYAMGAHIWEQGNYNEARSLFKKVLPFYTTQNSDQDYVEALVTVQPNRPCPGCVVTGCPVNDEMPSIFRASGHSYEPLTLDGFMTTAHKVYSTR